MPALMAHYSYRGKIAYIKYPNNISMFIAIVATL